MLGWGKCGPALTLGDTTYEFRPVHPADLPMEDFQTINYQGEGGKLLIMPGTGLGAKFCRAFAHRLHEALGITVRVVSLGGHKNGNYREYTSVEADMLVAEALRDIKALRQVGDPREPIVVIGDSLGSLVALDAYVQLAKTGIIAGIGLLDFPLILRSPFDELQQRIRWIYEPGSLRTPLRWLADCVCIRRNTSLSTEAMPDVNAFDGFYLRLGASLCSLQARLVRGFSRVRCPVLNINGTKDSIADPLSTSILLSRVVHCEQHLVQSGHGVLFSSEVGEMCASLVEDFVARVLAVSPTRHRKALLVG